MPVVEIEGETVLVSQLEPSVWEVACVECGEVGEVFRDRRGYGALAPGVLRWPRYRTLEDAVLVVWEAHRDDLYADKTETVKLVLALVLVLVNIPLWGRLTGF